jgi:hypothetical protein
MIDIPIRLIKTTAAGNPADEGNPATRWDRATVDFARAAFERGMTATQLSELMGIPLSTVRDWVKGRGRTLLAAPRIAVRPATRGRGAAHRAKTSVARSLIQDPFPVGRDCMTFGRYVGWRVKELPTRYLAFLMGLEKFGHSQHELRALVRDELIKRLQAEARAAEIPDDQIA